MKSTYDEALQKLLAHEGGYSNDAADPGGPTIYGITIGDVRAYLNPKATAADVKKLTVDQAKVIYRSHYANPLRYNDLPAGVDYAVFDYGVNSGTVRAAKVLQGILGVAQDGEIGDATIAAAKLRSAQDLINRICDERLVFLKGLRTWPTFGNGWGRRVSDVRSTALIMAVTAPTPKPSTPVAITVGAGGIFATILHFSGAHWKVVAAVAVFTVIAGVIVYFKRRS